MALLVEEADDEEEEYAEEEGKGAFEQKLEDRKEPKERSKLAAKKGQQLRVFDARGTKY